MEIIKGASHGGGLRGGVGNDIETLKGGAGNDSARQWIKRPPIHERRKPAGFASTQTSIQETK